MIELATVASVGCHSVCQGLCRLIDSVSSVTMIVNSLYFLSCSFNELQGLLNWCQYILMWPSIMHNMAVW